MKKLIVLRDLFLLFLIFAVLGWMYEVLLTMWAYGYFENRGFLFGPWLPIYGSGGLALYGVFGRLAGASSHRLRNVVLVFAGICALATVIELGASYLLDIAGVGFRSLWFYDGEPFNFDGRVSLAASLRFGVIGTAALYGAVPLWKKLCAVKKQTALNTVSTVLAVLFAIDLIFRIPFGSNL
ncbi:MAG: putative ABC transporter permease [Ruminiclostridium sp.]|nr:putative ABC transporter permease [Ruminiclostridium sp.]